MDSKGGQGNEPRHPIQVVARRTGLTPDVLRAWERRYGVVSPGRSSGSHRLYSDADIERLSLIRQAMAGGRRIHQVARLGVSELNALLEEDRRSSPAPVVPIGVSRPVDDQGPDIGSFLAAIHALDQPRLDAMLADAALRMPTPALIDRLLAPLMAQVGAEWGAGQLRVAHEHLATAAIRSLLGSLRAVRQPPPGAPEIVVGTPVNQQHELGALTNALLAEADGWQVTYLGANVPTDDLAAAVRQRGARAVALSIVFPPDDPQLGRELSRLRRVLSQGVEIIVGGPSAANYEATLTAIGASIASDSAAFRRRLEAVRRQTGLTG